MQVPICNSDPREGSLGRKQAAARLWRMVWRSAFLIVLAGGLGAGSALADPASPARGDRPAAESRVNFVRVPQGGIQPQSAIDATGVLHLIYFRGDAGAGDLFYVRREPGETQFSEPLRVNSQPDSAVATGTIRGGQLAIGRQGKVHVVWNGSSKALPRGPGKYDFPLLFASLNDSGTEFEEQRNMIHGAYGLDGGGSVAADDAGHVTLVWHAGSEGERARRVWIRRSHDSGRTFEEETAIDDPQLGACGCCGLKAFAGAAGTVHILYRSAETSTDRNMQLLVETEPGKGFRGSLVERWKISNCPMSSGAFARRDGATWGAWETAGQVSLTRLDEKTGEIGKLLIPPGTAGQRKHPSLAVGDKGKILLAWTEGTGWEKGGSLHWQEFDAAGKPTRVRGHKDGIPVWSFAAPITEPNGAYTIFY
jgi:hypothetical protein